MSQIIPLTAYSLRLNKKSDFNAFATPRVIYVPEGEISDLVVSNNIVPTLFTDALERDWNVFEKAMDIEIAKDPTSTHPSLTGKADVTFLQVGLVQGGAPIPDAQYYTATTGGSDGAAEAVTLPSVVDGKVLTIANIDTFDLQVFPASGEKIDDLDVNIDDTIAPLSRVTYVGRNLPYDEVRATTIIEVTDVGGGSDSITIEALDAGTTDVCTWTDAGSDSIADAVAALVASAQALGLVEVVASDATTLTITNIAGRGDTDNGSGMTVTVTGTATGTSSNLIDGQPSGTVKWVTANDYGK